MENLRLIKRITNNKLKKDFDSIYDEIRLLAFDKFNYDGELKIISDNKWINFYIIDDGEYTDIDYEYNIDLDIFQ